MDDELQYREMKYNEIAACADLVQVNWGYEAARRARSQMLQMFAQPPETRPRFFVAVDTLSNVWGFSGMVPSMLMKGCYELIWIAVATGMKNAGIGGMLVKIRLDAIAEAGGTMAILMTEKPVYFERFGFRQIDNLDGWRFMIKKMGKVEI